jgi:hypothetical protein
MTMIVNARSPARERGLVGPYWSRRAWPGRAPLKDGNALIIFMNVIRMISGRREIKYPLTCSQIGNILDP